MSPDADPNQEKLDSLLALLKEAGSAIIAFSGGVDSTFLLKAMSLAGMEKFLAVTAISDTMPEADYTRALSFAKDNAIELLVIRTDELSNEKFVRNAPDRCFHCKDELFTKIREIAKDRQLKQVFDGTNADDLRDYRPGRKASALHGVRSPLAECGFTKDDIRAASKGLGLSSWNLPSSPCLSSRFPYGRRITAASLKRVGAAEEYLRTFGLKTVRVRDHGDIARIEVAPEEMPVLLDASRRLQISERLRTLGYAFVALDLEGYRSGSMNRVLEDQQN